MSTQARSTESHVYRPDAFRKAELDAFRQRDVRVKFFFRKIGNKTPNVYVTVGYHDDIFKTHRQICVMSFYDDENNLAVLLDMDVGALDVLQHHLERIMNNNVFQDARIHLWLVDISRRDKARLIDGIDFFHEKVDLHVDVDWADLRIKAREMIVTNRTMLSKYVKADPIFTDMHPRADDALRSCTPEKKYGLGYVYTVSLAMASERLVKEPMKVLTALCITCNSSNCTC